MHIPHAKFKTNAPRIFGYAIIPALGLFLILTWANGAEADSSFVSLMQRRPLPEPANPKLPSLFLIGDSTVRNGQGDGANGQWGWGEPLVAYFDAAKINVVNRAVGGLSSRTYLISGQWEQVLARLKPGDFVIMQFGHNDGGAINDDSRARGTIKGTGEEAQEIDNMLTKQREVVHTYGWYLRKFIAETKAKGATPIVCSLVPRKIWRDGKIARNSADYGKWAAEVAKSEKARFIDLNEIIARRYDELGPEKVDPLFADAHTHTSLAGAELNAACVIAGLKALKDNPLAAYFSAKAKEVSQAEGGQAIDSGAPLARANKTIFKFDFGSGKLAPGYTQVLPGAIYSREVGYGFEPGAKISCVDRGGSDALRRDLCTSDQPFFFSVALPEGNYNVTITFGDADSETTTTVKAELRRLILEKVQTARGKFETRTFTVNLRTAQIATGGEVKLKDRERTAEIWAWDEKLTLEFNNARPAVNAIEIRRAADLPTIFLLGDSTVCDQPSEPYNSWGQMLPRFFKPGVAIANHAESGESLRSSLGARRLDKVMSLMKRGDYLIIQYGHNDQKERGEGIGAFTTYRDDLKHFIAETRKRGGIPVLVTPVQRRTFDAQGKITNSHGDYPDAVRQAAKEVSVPLIDLHAMSKLFYEALGPEPSKLAFKEGDGTHHNNYGSYQLAKCIVEGIKANKLNIAKFLVDDMAPFNPSRPDPLDHFKVPVSPQYTAVVPLGR
jgi:lysophospholipase L1-like esterase